MKLDAKDLKWRILKLLCVLNSSKENRKIRWGGSTHL